VELHVVTDRHPWRAALALGVVTIVFGMVYAIWVVPIITHRARWWVTDEVWPPLQAARFAANGALGYLYSADPYFVAGPIGAIVLIPVVLISDAMGLTDSYLFSVAHPTVWLVYGPYALGFSVVLLYAARALAQRAWVVEAMAARGLPPRHLWSQVAMFCLVLVPGAVVFGHYEDVLALAFVLLGIGAMMGGRFGVAALWFALAIGTKQWALLGVPILLAAAPARSRLRTLVWSLLPPGALMAFTLAVDWDHASRALLHTRSFPQVGHAALWIAHAAARTSVGSPERWGAVATAIALGWWLRGRGRPRLLVAGFAVAFLSRLVFEPVIFAYYLIPSLALLFLHERLTGRSGLRTAVGGGAILLFFPFHPNPWVWWAVTAVGLVWIAAPAVREVCRRAVSEESHTGLATEGTSVADLSPVGA
jgi:hypothetical protein